MSSPIRHGKLSPAVINSWVKCFMLHCLVNWTFCIFESSFLFYLWGRVFCFNSCSMGLGHLARAFGSTPNSEIVKLYWPQKTCDGLSGKPSVKAIVRPSVKTFSKKCSHGGAGARLSLHPSGDTDLHIHEALWADWAPSPGSRSSWLSWETEGSVKESEAINGQKSKRDGLTDARAHCIGELAAILGRDRVWLGGRPEERMHRWQVWQQVPECRGWG